MRYPAYIRTLLLTAQRRTDVARMAVAEISETIWTIPATRFKTKVENVVTLSRATLPANRARSEEVYLFDEWRAAGLIRILQIEGGTRSEDQRAACT